MTKRKLRVSAVTIALVMGSVFVIPAAVGAAPLTKAAKGLCISKPSGSLGTTKGLVRLSGNGSVTTGTPGSCSAKLTGKWAKNSTTFSLDGTGTATLGANGAWVMAPGTDLTPLTNAKLTGTLVGTGLPVGSALSIEVNCVISYPPLKIACTITIGFPTS